jgi:cytochrome c553
MKKTLMAIAAMASLSALGVATAAGDIASGEAAYNGKGCSGCHGEAGRSQIPTYPTLAGKEAAYLVNNLRKLRSGERESPVMQPMAAGLTDADIANLAAYLAAQK